MRSVEILPIDSPVYLEAIRALATELTRLGLPAREVDGWLRVEAAPKLRTPEVRRKGERVYFVFDGACARTARSCAGMLERFVSTAGAFGIEPK